MKYDVVIRCKNEMQWLPRVIDSIKKQTIQPSKIILVDNSSDDGSKICLSSKLFINKI